MLIENTRWGGKQSLPRTGTSQDLCESYLREWLWRQRYGDDPLETLSSTSPTYMKYAKMRKLFRVPLYALFVI